MPTVKTFGSWRLVMFTNDHEPAHVHLMSADGLAAAKLRLSDGEMLEQEGRVRPRLLQEVRNWMAENRAGLATLWSEYHERG